MSLCTLGSWSSPGRGHASQYQPWGVSYSFFWTQQVINCIRFIHALITLMESTHLRACFPPHPRNWAKIKPFFLLFCQLPVWYLAHRYSVTVRWVAKGTTYSDQLNMLLKSCSLSVAMAMQQSEAPVRILQRSTIHPSGIGSSPGVVNLSNFICFKTSQIWSLVFTNVCLLTA